MTDTNAAWRQCEAIVFEPPHYVYKHRCDNRGRFHMVRVTIPTDHTYVCGVHRRSYLRYGWGDHA